MSRSPHTRVLFARTLALAASSHAGEALNALRLAQRQLERAGLCWSDVGLTAYTRVPADLCDQTVRAVGLTFSPPIGESWLATVRALATSPDLSDNDRVFQRLMRLLGDLANAPLSTQTLSPRDAAFVAGTYRRWAKQEPQA